MKYSTSTKNIDKKALKNEISDIIQKTSLVYDEMKLTGCVREKLNIVIKSAKKILEIQKNIHENCLEKNSDIFMDAHCYAVALKYRLKKLGVDFDSNPEIYKEAAEIEKESCFLLHGEIPEFIILTGVN